MSDTPNDPEDPAGGGPIPPEDAAVENAVSSKDENADKAEEVAETKRRIWIMRILRRERREVQRMVWDEGNRTMLVTILSTAIVAGTAMYATLKTSADGRIESRRSTRVDALVEHWSSTIADASTAVELLGQRSNDLWAYALALTDQGVILEEALKNEATREKDFLSVRKNLAATTARAGLVSSVTTTACLDKFVALIDTWQNALGWTRSNLQIDGGVELAAEAVKMQFEHRDSLDGAITIVRRLARAELAKAGEAKVRCNLPDIEDVWAQLVPSEDTTTTEDGAPTEDTTPGSS